jgi:hypothetical protein
MTLQLLHSEFPYILGKFYFLFYQRAPVYLPTIINDFGRLMYYIRYSMEIIYYEIIDYLV